MFEKFDFWQDAKDNWANRQKDKMRNLLLKYGGVLDEDEMDDADWFEYQAAKKYESEVRRETAGSFSNYKLPAVFPVMTNFYKMAHDVGEFVADSQIAYQYKREMDDTGRKLVKQYGSGQGADIDNYYHALLQCELAKISPKSQRSGIWLGYGKEGYDYLKKRYDGMDEEEIIADMEKDLQNNLYGSRLGAGNKHKSCRKMLKRKRTKRMRDAGIW